MGLGFADLSLFEFRACLGFHTFPATVPVTHQRRWQTQTVCKHAKLKAELTSGTAQVNRRALLQNKDIEARFEIFGTVSYVVNMKIDYIHFNMAFFIVLNSVICSSTSSRDMQFLSFASSQVCSPDSGHSVPFSSLADWTRFTVIFARITDLSPSFGRTTQGLWGICSRKPVQHCLGFRALEQVFKCACEFGPCSLFPPSLPVL